MSTLIMRILLDVRGSPAFWSSHQPPVLCWKPEMDPAGPSKTVSCVFVCAGVKD